MPALFTSHYFSPRSISTALALAVSAGTSLVAPGTAQADYSWTCGDGNWEDSCWLNSSTSIVGGAPPASSNAYLTSTDGGARTIQYNSIYSTPLQQLVVDATNGGAMQVQQSNPLSQLLTTRAYIGRNGVGSYTQSAGTHTSGNLTLGYDYRSSGTYLLENGILNATSEFIGDDGDGDFIQTGGSNTVNNLWLAYGRYTNGTQGNYTLNAGTLSVGNEYIAGDWLGGSATFTQAGGIHTIAARLEMGFDTGNSGTYYLQDGILNSQSERFGVMGSARFFQTGGSHTVTDFLHLGADIGNGERLYELSNGSLSVGSEAIGSMSAAYFRQSGGTHTIVGDLIVGQGSLGRGSYFLDGGSFTVGNATTHTGNEFIGERNAAAIGNFTQNGGIHTVGNELRLGYAADQGIGTYNLQGGHLKATTISINNANSSFSFTGGRLEVGTFNGDLTNHGGTFAVGGGNTTLINGDFLQLAGITEVTLDNLLTDNGDAVLDAGETYLRLSSGNNIYLDGAVRIKLSDGMNIAVGDTFDLMAATDINCLFCDANGLFNYTETNGFNWTLSLLTDAKGPTDILRLTINAVPVPTAAWLFGSGLMGLIGWARRKA